MSCTLECHGILEKENERLKENVEKAAKFGLELLENKKRLEAENDRMRKQNAIDYDVSLSFILVNLQVLFFFGKTRTRVPIIGLVLPKKFCTILQP